MQHNPAGRAFLIADFLKRKRDVTLVGPMFERYGDGTIWPPITEFPIDMKTFKAEMFPEFLTQVKTFVRSLDTVDVVIICKPRIPSIILGLITAKYHRAKIVLDIDDHELSFFTANTELSLDEIDQLSQEELLTPFSESWSRIAESLIKYFPSRIVSNLQLQNKFGGTILPHVRDETRFRPTWFRRSIIRFKLGYSKKQKVILFLGTPRPHKGFMAVAEALKKLNNPAYKFCIVGSKPNKKFQKKIEKDYGEIVSIYPEVAFSDLPKYLQVADLICLIQDPTNQISKYQMPAKFSDALSMGIPILASKAAPLKDLAQEGLVETLGDGNNLHEMIDEIFKNYDFYKSKAKQNRTNQFISGYSYNAGIKILNEVLKNHKIQEIPELTNFMKRINQRFHGNLDKIDPENLTVVFFWKQNDSGLYGRRQDMFVKYLAQNTSIKRVIHFDAAISHLNLLEKRDISATAKFYEGGKIFENTLGRIQGRRSGEKLIEYTFVYNQNGNAKPKDSDLEKLGVNSLPNRKEYMQFINNTIVREGVRPEDCLFWFCPVIKDFNDLMTVFNPAHVISDFIDDQRSWSSDQERLDIVENNYRDILKMSDTTLCNNSDVGEFIESCGVDPLLITNGVESHLDVNLGDIPDELAKLNGPIIGYVGNLDPERLDVSIIMKMAKERQDWNFVMIGSAHTDPTVLDDLNFSNIYLLGMIPYDECIHFIKHFDVALIPHYDNKMTKSMNPLKLYVYQSLGIPVVASDLHGLELMDGKQLSIAKGQNDFIPLIEKSFHSKKTFIQNSQLENTWKFKVDQIMKTITNRVDG